MKKSFFDQVKKIQLPTGLKSKEVKPKALSVVKDDTQAFVVTLETNTDLSKALNCSVKYRKLKTIH